MLRLQRRRAPLLVASAIVLLAAIFGVLHHRTAHHSVLLTWHAPVEKLGVTVVGYEVYRSVNSGGPYVRIASGVKELAYRDWMVNNETSYYYVVKSVDAAGHESPYSAEVRADIP